METPFENAALACECIVTSIAFASQVMEAERLSEQAENGQSAADFLLQTYAFAWMDGEGAAEA